MFSLLVIISGVGLAKGGDITIYPDGSIVRKGVFIAFGSYSIENIHCPTNLGTCWEFLPYTGDVQIGQVRPVVIYHDGDAFNRTAVITSVDISAQDIEFTINTPVNE